MLTLKCRKVFVSFAKLRENDNAKIFAETFGMHLANNGRKFRICKNFAKNKVRKLHHYTNFRV